MAREGRSDRFAHLFGGALTALTAHRLAHRRVVAQAGRGQTGSPDPAGSSPVRPYRAAPDPGGVTILNAIALIHPALNAPPPPRVEGPLFDSNMMPQTTNYGRSAAGSLPIHCRPVTAAATARPAGGAAAAAAIRRCAARPRGAVARSGSEAASRQPGRGYARTRLTVYGRAGGVGRTVRRIGFRGFSGRAAQPTGCTR